MEIMYLQIYEILQERRGTSDNTYAVHLKQNIIVACNNISPKNSQLFAEALLEVLSYTLELKKNTLRIT